MSEYYEYWHLSTKDSFVYHDSFISYGCAASRREMLYSQHMNFRSASSVIGIALVLVYVVGSGLWVNTGDGWYRSLNKPSLQPPDFIFGLIWPYNFIVLGIAAVVVSQRASKPVVFTYMAFFAVSVVAALVWAYQFYRPHDLVAASIALTGTMVLTVPMIVILFTVSIPMAIAVLPYQVWVAVASTISWGYSKLN
jgi:tryptophan-rich sensory protein